MKKGKLIVIEGTDCSGKETQAKLLVEKLKSENIPCRYMTFPRYDTPTGKIIGESYLGRTSESFFEDATKLNPMVASLYYAADRLDAKDEMNDLLNEGTTIICDRYVESNMGHQGGKIRDPKERLEIFEWIRNLEYDHFNLPKPDKVVFLYMPFEIGMELKKDRPGIADGHERDPDHLRNAEEAYLQLAEFYGWDKIDCATGRDVGSLKTIDEIASEVFASAIKVVA